MLEKLASRMVPLFAIACLFDGVSFSTSLTGLSIVFLTNAAGNGCRRVFSALPKFGIAAFWYSDIALAAVYFTLSVLHEMGLVSLNIVGL